MERKVVMAIGFEKYRIQITVAEGIESTFFNFQKTAWMGEKQEKWDGV